MSEPDEQSGRVRPDEEEALHLKTLAEDNYNSGDLNSALEHATRAHNLHPSITGLTEMLTAFKVLCAAAPIHAAEKSTPDYYGILQLERFSHINSIKKQYKKLALTLHPDKNPSAPSEEAFKLVGEAARVLSDKIRREEYDMRLRIAVQSEATEEFGLGAKDTFSTACSNCGLLHQYERKYLGHYLNCHKCKKTFRAKEVEKDTNNGGDEGMEEKNEEGVGGQTRVSARIQEKVAKGGHMGIVERLGLGVKKRISRVGGDAEGGDKKVEKVMKSGEGDGMDAVDDSMLRSERTERAEDSEEEAMTLFQMKMLMKKRMKSGKETEVDAVELQGKENEGEYGKNEDREKKKSGKETEVDAVVLQGKGKGKGKYKGYGKNEDKEKKKRKKSGKETAVDAVELQGKGKGKEEGYGKNEDREKKRKNKSGKEIEVDAVEFLEKDEDREKKKMKKRKENVRVDEREHDIEEEDEEITMANLMEKANKRRVSKDLTIGAISNLRSKVVKAGSTKKGNLGVLVEEDGKEKEKGMENTREKRERQKPLKFASFSETKTNTTKNGADIEIKPVEDSDFHDFDKDRMEKSFKKGQVWAVYDDDDGMARHYGLIDRVISRNPFKVTYIWLRFKSNGDVNLLSWPNTGVHVSCGIFQLSRKVTIKYLRIFSHLVDCERAARELYRIYPKKGSVWAMYRNPLTEERDLRDKETRRYDIIVSLTSYSDVHGLSVAYLEKVPGFRTVFKRREVGANAVMFIGPKDVGVLSHQIPAKKLSGEESSDLPKDCWELDPASLTPQLLIAS